MDPGSAPPSLPPDSGQIALQRSGEVRTELDQYLERLAILGATPDELLGVVETWDVVDQDWTPETRRRVSRSTDRELAAMLMAARVEYAHDTTVDDGVWQPGMDIPVGTVVEILAWVGSDADRAYTVYETELSRDDKARPELLSLLKPLIAGV